MHEIEKHVVVDKLMCEVWQNYVVILSELGGVKMPEFPAFETSSEGTGTAGRFFPSTKTVWINLAYYHGGDTKQLRETIAHELAHHICHHLYPDCKQWHGPEFRWVMMQIGYDGNTYHAMSRAMAVREARKAKDMLFNLD